MTIGQLARAGAFLRAARLIRRGKEDIEILLELRREFLVGTDQQYWTIIKLAHAGVQAADTLEAAGPDGSIDVNTIPLLPR